MKLSADLTAFCARLGHDFARPKLLNEALTHSSFSSATRRDNQRLEFLGDRVLGLVIAQALLEADADAEEGVMAPRLNALVRKETCAEIAASIGLGDVLRLGRSEMMSGGRRKQALLGDAMEAVIAAVYLDAGHAAAQDLILRLWAEKLAVSGQIGQDAKTRLQEWAQARGMTPPSYTELGRAGPDHALIFDIEVRLANGASARAKANSKRAAQQQAAADLLTRLEADNDH